MERLVLYSSNVTTKEVPQVGPSATVSSFRVYTPHELKYAILRPANRPTPERGLAEELKESVSVGIERVRTNPRTVGKWIAIGIGSIAVLFAAVLGLANATDDTGRPRSERHASSSVESPLTHATASSPATELPAPMKAPPVASSDFEVADNRSAPPQTSAKHRRVLKHGKRNASDPMTIRTPPF
jgi:hypothetical protein